MIDADEDREIFMGDFAVDAALWPGGAGPVSVRAIFTAAHALALDGGVSSDAPMLSGFVSDFAGLDRGDRVEVAGGDWRVADFQPDGAGMARVILERN